MSYRSSSQTTLEKLVVLGAAFAVLVGAIPPPLWAEITEEEIAFDSEITLLERNDYGTYSRYSIRLNVESGDATLTVDKDGRTKQGAVPLEECQELWRTLLDAGLEALKDPSAGIQYPDQSEFTVRFAVAGQRGGFRAYDVDSLSNPRYREIVVAILSMGDSYLESPAGVQAP